MVEQSVKHEGKDSKAATALRQTKPHKAPAKADLARENLELMRENRELLARENGELRKKLGRLAERMEYLEDSLDAHIALQEFRESGEEAIPWAEVEAELDTLG